MLVAVQRHDWHLKVWVPHVDIEIEAAADQHLVLLAVGHFAHGPVVTFERLDGRDGQITENFIAHWMVLEVRLNLVLHGLLRSAFFRIVAHVLVFRVGAVVDLLLAQVPQVDLAIVDSSGQLVDVRQVLQALDEIVDEPRSVLCPVRDVFFLLLIAGHLLLLSSIGARDHRRVLIRLVVRVADLRLVVEREEELDIPSEDGTLSSTGKEELLLAPLDVAEALLS